jgi:hypothetical protein
MPDSNEAKPWPASDAGAKSRSQPGILTRHAHAHPPSERPPRSLHVLVIGHATRDPRCSHDMNSHGHQAVSEACQQSAHCSEPQRSAPP